MAEKTGYVLGFIIFPDDVHMQFVLLVIGICLMKGISNFWTVCLNGNVELSVAMSILNALLSSGKLELSIVYLSGEALRIINNYESISCA